MSNYRPRRLSHSAIELYARCPAAYARRYVHGVVDPRTPEMAFGACFATALEALHRGQDGETAWVREYARLQALGELPYGSPSIEHGLALLGLYQQRGVLQGTPEQRWEFHLPDREAVPVPLLGYMDLMTATDVLEVKTSGGHWDQGRADNSTQAHLYAWAFHRLTGRKPDCVRFLVFSTRTVSMQEFVTYPACGELRLFELKAAAVWRGIVAGEYPPACAQRWCGACTEAGLYQPPTRGLELEV